MFISNYTFLRMLIVFRIRKKWAFASNSLKILVKNECYTYKFFSFISQGALTRRQQSDLFGLCIKLPPVTTSLTTQSWR